MTCFCRGQVLVQGLIKDSISGIPVPFASVGMQGKNIGTLSNELGKFTISIPAYAINDTLRFGSIGYKTRSIAVKDIAAKNNLVISLVAQATELKAVTVKAKKVKYKTLGTTKYKTNNCTGFADIEGNWKGSEAAILIKNDKNVLVENFSFYVIQNKYEDSLLFRLNFYKRIPAPANGPSWLGSDWVGPSLLRKAIIFKMGSKQGEFTLPLKDHNINIEGDFFVSLECLMDEMEIKKFCYAGSPGVTSFIKVKAFSKWHRSSARGGGGADFNVKVSYNK
jgi:hypothetical protein